MNRSRMSKEVTKKDDTYLFEKERERKREKEKDR